jgi:hypothetical protein
MRRKGATVNQGPPILTAAPEQREVLRQALADAVYYRDPPARCPACPSPDVLCAECAAGLVRARSYLALGRALGLDTPA